VGPIAALDAVVVVVVVVMMMIIIIIITPWSRVLLKKLAAPQLVSKFLTVLILWLTRTALPIRCDSVSE
jgi:uncharacterized membrane protein (DUF373 family)